jgi:hypothetical protein
MNDLLARGRAVAVAPSDGQGARRALLAATPDWEKVFPSQEHLEFR